MQLDLFAAHGSIVQWTETRAQCLLSFRTSLAESVKYDAQHAAHGDAPSGNCVRCHHPNAITLKSMLRDFTQSFRRNNITPEEAVK